jgi:dihydroorotate dehydrogenase
MDAYGSLLRPLLFHLDAEVAHHLMIGALARARPFSGLIRRLHPPADARLACRLWDLRFASPAGLAAGLDKNGVAIDALASCGFSHVEIGTVTGRAQPGNPRPRLFRLPGDQALINRMGFNNDGAEAVARRLAQRYGGRRPACILGINLGKSKLVDNAQALDDYRFSLTALAPHADYLVINVSSPNTPGLRDLQAEAALRPLLSGVRACLDQVLGAAGAAGAPRRVPLLLKIAPDLDDAGIDACVEVALECGCDGLIATNTTITRRALRASPRRIDAIGAGGLSGAPLRARALAVLARVARRVARRVPVIGVGGIDSAQAAWERIGSGASLVQLYSALVYRGPALIAEINRGLLARLEHAGLKTIGEAVGRDL